MEIHALMKPNRFFLAFLLTLFALPIFPILAQDSEKKSLTFQRHPYQFNSSNPLKPDSPMLLEFSQEVNPASVPRSFRYYDKSNQRFAPLSARRPTPEEITSLRKRSDEPSPVSHFVLIRPASDLPLGGSWYINARAGFASATSGHTIVESRLDYIGSLYGFNVDNITAYNPYDGPRVIRVHHNKRHLNREFDPDKVTEYVSISPKPKNFEVKLNNYQINLHGDFAFGTDYTVTVSNGLVAYDKTQLTQKTTESVRFEPNEAFVNFPAFSTTQNAAGHRRFDVKTGNITGLRTRVKRLNGDNLILAQNEYDEKYEGWGEEQALAFTSVPGNTIYDQFRESTVEIDNREIVSLDWDELTDGSKTGAFYLCSEGRSSTTENKEYGAQSIVQLTDIGLVWKQSSDETVFYAFSLKSGNPLEGTSICIVDGTTTKLAQVRTDASGIARIDATVYQDNENRLYLDASRNADRYLIQFHEDLDTVGLWSFGIDQRYDDIKDGERRTLLFTDRNVYKPGHEVKVKGIARFVDEDKLLGPGSGNAKMRVFDSRHRKILDREIILGETGIFDDSFTLPSAGMGWHSIELDFNPEAAEHPDWRLIARHSFQVEEYRVNTFEISLDAEKSYILTDEIEIPVSANYYMGKSLSKAEMQWNVYAYSDYPRPRGFDEFRFGDLTINRGSHTDEGTTKLTSQGKASIPVNLPEQKTSPGPRRVSVTAQITDANQQTLSGSSSFLVHSSDFYLGIREPDGTHRAGDTATFSLAAVSTEGKAHTDEVPLTILLEKEIYNTVKVMGANGRITHRNDRRLQMINEETINLKTNIEPETGLTQALPHNLTFAEAGDYIITLTARDASGRPVITRNRFTVIGAEEPSWSWYDVTRIDLIPDKESYEIGDTAKLLVRSPVFGHALLSTERGGVRSTESLKIDQYETVVEVPIEEGAAPNIFASVLIIRGSEESPHIHTSADYRLGYCKLEVDDADSHLEITIDTGNAEYFQPGEEVEVVTTITDVEGKGVGGAEVTLWAVDEGVLSLTGHQTPDPHEEFHRSFVLSVFTGQSLNSLLPENPLEQDFGNKGYVIGGGGATPGLDPDRVRKDFKALAFWEPTLTTDVDGIVRANFTAPDNLTEFRIMAVVAEANRFGSGEKSIIINKPLIIEPALPVFTNVTDQVDVSAVLHNNTAKLQEVEVSVELDNHAVFIKEIGAKIPTNLSDGNGETSRTVSAILEAGATETLSFPIALTQTGEAKWNWKVRSLSDEKLRDATESTTPVGFPLPLLRESHSFTLREGESLGDALDRVNERLRQGTGEVEVTLSNSRLVEASDALDYLLQYPYGCVEQTTSSLIPWLTSNQLRQVMPKLEKSEEEVDAITTTGVQRLFSMQTGDGGLGYWPGSSQSVLWGSAYGGVAIAMARKEGVAVPEQQANALWQYLSKNLRDTAKMEKAYDLSQRCLASYTLALAGAAEPAYHDLLFEKRAQLSGEARALLALAMIESGAAADERITTLLSPDPNVPVAEVSWYKQPYVASTRLLAQLRHDPQSKRVDALVGDLMKLRKPTRGWGSTYSNAWPLIALATYSEVEAASMSANNISVAFGGEESTITLPARAKSGAATFTFDGSVQPDALKIDPKGSSPVYATMTVETRPALMPIEPEHNGFSIERTYEKVNTDGNIAPAKDLRVGDLILVTLDINIPNEMETYLAIDDALPAIFEAVNPTFKTQATQKVNQEKQKRRLYASYREIKKNRVLFFADSVYRSGDYSLQYLARVVAPGEVTAPPAKIEAMYEPQRFGLSGTGRIHAAARDLSSGKVAAVQIP